MKDDLSVVLHFMSFEKQKSFLFKLEIFKIDTEMRIKYINTFALQNNNDQVTETDNCCQEHHPNEVSLIATDKDQLNKLNVFQLNELIEQIENNTKELSEILVQVNFFLIKSREIFVFKLNHCLLLFSFDPNLNNFCHSYLNGLLYSSEIN